MRKNPPNGFHVSEITFAPDVWPMVTTEMAQEFALTGSPAKPSGIVNRCIREVLGKKPVAIRRPKQAPPRASLAKTGSR